MPTNTRLEVLCNLNNRTPRALEYPHKVDAVCGGERAVKLSELFALYVYGMKELRETLPKPVYIDLIDQMAGRRPLNKNVADAVAHAVKVWAMERGATHFTHWFQPLTNSTAQKHDSFLSLKYQVEGGNLSVLPLDSFSGSQLTQAEPDASSFPSGGMRTTFEARGYTVWDTTSPMFLQDGPHDTKILCIPSIFISYNGEALDEKTILLRSCDVLSKAVLELLSLLGDKETKRVHITLGTEQEFFLVDRTLYSLRPDLKLVGRTLLGALPPKHQQLEDHYFGHIPSRVLAAISEAELELWKLGVPIKTRHNEVAPQQFEVAPVFEEASVAVDHNLLTMEILHKVAHRHGLKALFHEKPFKGVNGSGKHCNWSLCTDTGKNLLEPTETPEENTTFIIMLLSILLGLKRHSGLLRAAIASASNDYRLGANEAPPSIISAFLGAQLNELLNSLEEGRPMQLRRHSKSVTVGGTKIDVKIAHLPEISRDATDRNRTSPFAFTGNRFEFRAVGSGQSPSFPVSMLNAATAAALEDVIKMLKERMGPKPELSKQDISEVAKTLIKETKAIRFDGDGYSAEWAKEAEKRGLLNIRRAPEAFEQLMEKTNKEMLVRKLEIVNESELHSRFNVLCQKYTKDLLIEAKTLRQICIQQVLPASFKYRKELAAGLAVISQVSSNKPLTQEKKLLDKLTDFTEKLSEALSKMDTVIGEIEEHEGDHGAPCEKADKAAKLAADRLPALLIEVRSFADKLESDLADEYFPLPKYTELLFS